MHPSATDPNYDPANFVRDHPHDEKLQEALKAARDLAAKTAPLLPGETEEAAQKRINHEFGQLAVAVDKDLDQHNKSEMSGFKMRFAQEREAEMRAATLKGIENTNSLENKLGGQFALDSQIRSFRENIDNNEQWKTEQQQLLNYQAARSEAISHAIQYTPPRPPDVAAQPAPDDSPTPDPPKRLKGETDHNYDARGVETNQPQADATPEQPKRLKGESDQNYETRSAETSQPKTEPVPESPQIQPRRSNNLTGTGIGL